jgi:hypothetical protein
VSTTQSITEKVERVLYFLISRFFLGLTLVMGVILLNDGLRRALTTHFFIGVACLFLFAFLYKSC